MVGVRRIRIMTSYKEVIDELYSTFSKYKVGKPFDCGYCHSDEWQQYYIDTPLRELTGQHGYELVTEVADHWANSQIYKHYLPRILELLGPPYLVDDLCPEFIFEKLILNEFHSWEQRERDIIFQYFSFLDNEYPFDCDKEDWDEAYLEFTKA